MKNILCILFALIFILPAFSNNYDFSDEATERFFREFKRIVVPKGSVIHSRLNADIDSQSNQTNDVVTTQLMKDWIYDSKVIAPEGSLISGKITDKKKPAKVMGDAKLYIDFDKIIRPDGMEIIIDSKPIIITGNSRLQGLGIVIATGVMVFLSAGAALPAGAALVAYTASSGEEIKIPLGTEFKIHIMNDVDTYYYDN